MSRIHDALRRGRLSGAETQAIRPGHTDAVLSALGYKSEAAESSPKPIAAIVVMAAIGIVATWYFWPREPARPVTARPTPALVTRSSAPPSTPPVTRPVPAPPPAPAAATIVTSAANVAPQVQQVAAPINPRREPATRVPTRDDFQLALYYQRTGDFEQALVHYKAALERDELNLQAHNNLGYLYLGKGLLDEAVREFQRVIAIEPGYVTAHVNLSATFIRLGRFDAAAGEARQALTLDPRSGDAFVNLALAQNASGQVADAQGNLRRALDLDPRNPAAHYNLARQYEAAGDAGRALDHYRQFLQYAGPDQEAYAQDVRARVQALQTRIK